MTNEKRTAMFTFRLDSDFIETVSRLIVKHDAKGKSEYFRGLIYLDALLSGIGTASLDKPRWVSKAFPQFFPTGSVRYELTPDGHLAFRTPDGKEVTIDIPSAATAKAIAKLQSEKAKEIHEHHSRPKQQKSKNRRPKAS